MLCRAFCPTALLALGGACSVFGAAAPSITPTADTFVSAAAPGNNYGAAGALEVSGTSLSKGEFDSFIRFNFASTKNFFDTTYGAGNWSPTSVTLQLTTSAPNNALFNTNTAGSFQIQLNNSNAWVEGTGSPNAPDTAATSLNFNNHANYEGAADPSLGIYSFTSTASGTATVYTLTLAAGLVADVRNGVDASLYVSAVDPTMSYLFNSTNFGTVASRPTLVVNAVPEPSTFALLTLAAGAAVLGGASRLRRRGPSRAG